ncbi:hypothetical protein [Noviherbaspirillum saxi]|uniref:Uncharacterized protein n=1 Tax=Noviherbaspirillum saxi TaxID=2320863 RepID=A0A3A3GDL3_9BURK|nr:hypothetical protein [Noviherbaspirillum saxi]RJF98989.1 hypothetical protein D3871_11060 [Noviherbaspirillum saxi]
MGFSMPAAEHTARQLEILVEAACHYGLVLELLSVIHEMQNGRQLDAEDEQLVNVASVASLLAKVERSHRGIDTEEED